MLTLSSPKEIPAAGWDFFEGGVHGKTWLLLKKWDWMSDDQTLPKNVKLVIFSRPQSA